MAEGLVKIEALKRWGYRGDPFEGPVVAGQRLEVDERRARFLEQRGRAARLDGKGKRVAPAVADPLGQTESGHDIRLVRQAPVAQLPSEVGTQASADPLTPSASPTGAKPASRSSSDQGRPPRKSAAKTGKKSVAAKKPAKRKSAR